jgi:hypothetical protein
LARRRPTPDHLASSLLIGPCATGVQYAAMVVGKPLDHRTIHRTFILKTIDNSSTTVAQCIRKRALLDGPRERFGHC